MSRRVLLLLAWVMAGLTVDATARPGGGQSSSGGSRTSGGGGSYRSSSGGGYRSSSSSSSKPSSTPSSTPSSSGTSSSSGTYSGSSAGNTIALIAGGSTLAVFMAIVLGNVLGARRSADLPRKRRRKVLDLNPLLKRDPHFSRAVFEDFVFELYAAAHRGRGTAQEKYGAYLSPAVVTKLASRGPAPQQVVIGTLALAKVRYVHQPAVVDSLVVHIEATLIGESNTYAVERWTFSRQGNVTSRPPSRVRSWPCPNCGAPWQASAERTCTHCGESVAGGRFDWFVDSIQVVSETKALASLRGTVPEQGNDLPTVEDPAAKDRLRQLGETDPHVTWDALTGRIRMIYTQLNTAWNERDLGKVRGLVTASLRNYLDYWLREYARQGLYNQLADAKVKKIELAKITRDAYFDAITVRVFADGVDYTRTEQNGKIVGGSKSTRRPYTEYWTFVRSADRRGVVHTDVACPNCGAPISMSDVGDCTHCNAAIENGSIDWTLSRIEQDDSYAG